MFDTDWKLVADGNTLRQFQSTLVDANLALDQNGRGIYVTTADVEVVLTYLTRLHERISADIYNNLFEQVNLCEIATSMYEAPATLLRDFDEGKRLFIRFWLQAKIDMLGSALYQEQPSAQKASIRFLAHWHMVVSDRHL